MKAATDTTRTNLETSARTLQQRLSDSRFLLPLYVRFREHETEHLLPLLGISLTADGITVLTEGLADAGVGFFSWDMLTAIEVLCDARRSPVFLHDFAAESHLAKELEAERELGLMLAERAAAEYVLLQQWIYDRVHDIPAATEEEPVQMRTDRFSLPVDASIAETDEELANFLFRDE